MAMASSGKFDADAFYERLLRFGQRCQKLVSKLPRTQYNLEYGSQLIRSSASPGSNYIEALEASSRRDFIHKLKTCRKESRESVHWLRLIKEANIDLKEISKECSELFAEGRELVKILTASITTSEKKIL